jgi:uncharacterized protein (UPF0248 family)
MTPIQDLLSQIRWDESFGQGNFVIGYYDRKSGEIIQIPLQQMQLTPNDHFFFRFIDQEGRAREIPLHRIREVYRNGELIWHRRTVNDEKNNHS